MATGHQGNHGAIILATGFLASLAGTALEYASSIYDSNVAAFAADDNMSFMNSSRCILPNLAQTRTVSINWQVFPTFASLQVAQ
jgi:hypothetical protein